MSEELQVAKKVYREAFTESQRNELIDDSFLDLANNISIVVRVGVPLGSNTSNI